jgi:exonuclease III
MSMNTVKQTKFIKVGCWNVQGLLSKDVDKTKEELFTKEIENFDIIGLLETHIVEGQSNIPSINGYDTKYFNRPKHTRATHGSGGIAILIKPHLRPGIKFIPSPNNDYVWVELNRKFFNTQQNIYLCVAYVPPFNSTYTRRLEENILDRIETDVYKYKNKGDIILMGDLNGRTGRNQDYIRNDSDRHLPLNEDYSIDINQKLEQVRITR